MRLSGFSDADIDLVYGHVPPEMTRDEFIEAFLDEEKDEDSGRAIDRSTS